MAQHDYVIDNANGASFRTDLNNALAAIKSANSGSTAPSSPVAGMPWFDTSTGEYKWRNNANTAWEIAMPKGGGTFSGGIAIDASGQALSVGSTGTNANNYLRVINDARQYHIGIDGTPTTGDDRFYIYDNVAGSVRYQISAAGNHTFAAPASGTAVVMNGSDVLLNLQATGGTYGGANIYGPTTGNSYIFLGNASNSERVRLWANDSRELTVSIDGGSNHHLKIDAGGRVLNPANTQPFVDLNSSATRSTAGQFASFSGVTDQGSWFDESTGTGTAPCAGILEFSVIATCFVSSGTGSCNIKLNVGARSILFVFQMTTLAEYKSFAHRMRIAASDSVTMTVESVSGTSPTMQITNASLLIR